ncbi:MAG: hypothetical protein MZV64_04600 [Ignavibacteriales bacterium]|nr:hypothetical protein [Ignavibacteriales bacterium]
MGAAQRACASFDRAASTSRELLLGDDATWPPCCRAADIERAVRPAITTLRRRIVDDGVRGRGRSGTPQLRRSTRDAMLDKLKRRVRRLRHLRASPRRPNLTYLGLYALQHRGQESGGIAASDGERLIAPSGAWATWPTSSREAELARLPGTAGHRPRPLLDGRATAGSSTRSRSSSTASTGRSRSATTATW